ncbi:MAG: ROK family protein [Fimbriiglobus sp.]
MNPGYWIGVDLGGTKILAGLFDNDLNLLVRSKQPTSSEAGPSGVMARIIQAVDAIVTEAKIEPDQIRGLCLAIPGQIEPLTSKVRFAPNLGWKDYDVLAAVPEHWKWKILVENDVRMATYGEFALGSAAGAKHVFGLFVGTGVGGGFILNSELFHGFNGHAGEIGHIVVQWRQGTSLESIAGRKYQMKRAKKILDDSPKRVRREWKGIDLTTVKSSMLAEFYQKGDPVAVQIVDDAARAIGAGVASVVNLMSPQVVVIGGGVMEALGNSFHERIWDFAQRYILPGAAENMKYLRAALGDDSGITGCAAYAKALVPKL